MNIQFVIDQQPLDLLCFHFISDTQNKSKKIIINTILLKMMELPRQHALNTLFQHSLQTVENNTNGQYSQKQYNKNMAILINEIISKSNTLLIQANQETINRITQYGRERVFCAVAGNDFINMLYSIIKKRQSAHISHIIEECLLDNRMAIASYRQSSRYHLFYIILRVLQSKTTQNVNLQYLQKVLCWVQQEKDPRNIQLVFSIYLWMLHHIPNSNLALIKDRMFDNLSNYYPIDFEGDTEKHNINLHRIINLLNQCLCHSLFQTQLNHLLNTKMSATPISMYIPTFIINTNKTHTHTHTHNHIYMNLLLRTAQSDYLQQGYDGCELQLSDLVIRLLQLIYPKTTLLSLQSYSCIIKWLQLMVVTEIYRNQDNSKHAGAIITIIKKITNKCGTHIKSIIHSYIINKFITLYPAEGDIIYKMGILVPILQDRNHHNNDHGKSQQNSLLVMSLMMIFAQSTEHPPKLLVLKLLMILKHATKKVIYQSNIQHTCLTHLQNPQTQTTIAKAYSDFLVQFYSHDDTTISAITQHNNASIMVYGTLSLYHHNKHILPSIIHIFQHHHQQLISIVKLMKLSALLQIISIIPSDISIQQLNHIEEIVVNKLHQLQQSQIQQYIVSNIAQTNPSWVYITKKLWRQHLHHANVRELIKNKLQSLPTSYITSYSIIYYNKAIRAYNINQQHIHIQTIKQISDRILPITVTAQESINITYYNNLWPTLTHYIWIHISNIQQKLSILEHLPNSILMQEANTLLPQLLKLKRIQTISNILSSIPTAQIVSRVLPFVLRFMSQIGQQTRVRDIIGVHKIVEQLIRLGRQQQQVHYWLVKEKGSMMGHIQDNILQHKKRLARQSGRKIFAQLNNIK